MNKYKIIIEKTAETDMKELVMYISQILHEPNIAVGILQSIKEAIMKLDALPYRHGVLMEESYSTLGVRKIPVKNYMIFYLVDETHKSVYIIRVLYNRREWKNLL